MPTNTPRGYPKPLGGDAAPAAIKTSLAGALDLLDADVTALVAADVALAARLGPPQLVNGGMELNQRGGTVTADLAYAHDRWQFLKGGTSTISITDETTIVDTGSGHSLKAVYTHGTAVSFIDQKLEHYLQLRSRTLTFAIRVRKGVSSSVRPYIQDTATKTYGATSVTTGSFTTMTVTLAIGAGATSVRVGVELSISDTVYLDNATLALGSVALDYAPVDAAIELARSQRYYKVLGGSGGESFGAGHAVATNRAVATLFHGAPMAVTPTVTFSASSDFRVIYGNYNIAVVGTMASIPGTAAVALDCQSVTGSPLVLGQGIYVDGLSTARIRLEANP